MDLQRYFEGIQDRIVNSAHVKTVFGEPIVAEGKTIIPAARIRYGFGAGMGSGPSRSGDEQRLGQGGGGGGGVVAIPIGVVEVTAAGTRFVSIESRRRTRLLVLAGFIAGYLWSRR
jgi:uncharacterized spore protein YtfJ